MTDARAQLLATIEGAVTETLDRQLDGIAEDLAERIAERLGMNGAQVAGDGMIDAAEVARRFGCSRDWIYANADRLGAKRMGDGPKARLRFDPGKVDAALETDAPQPEPPPSSRPWRATPRSSVDLLPIRGKS